MKDIPIGEVFIDRHGDYIKVCNDCGCRFCHFYINDIQEECKTMACMGHVRKDGFSVSFKKLNKFQVLVYLLRKAYHEQNFFKNRKA